MSNRNPKAARRPAGCPGIGDRLQARFFRALCDPRRLALLVRLAERGQPCSVSEVAACCPTDLSVVSRHLALLRDAGILAAEKRGREVYYSVRASDLAATLRAMADAIENCGAPVVPRKGKRP